MEICDNFDIPAYRRSWSGFAIRNRHVISDLWGDLLDNQITIGKVVRSPSMVLELLWNRNILPKVPWPPGVALAPRL